jgi:hypothetical protein
MALVARRQSQLGRDHCLGRFFMKNATRSLRTPGQFRAFPSAVAMRGAPRKRSEVIGLNVPERADRFTYWPVRLARDGEILAPGDGNAAREKS